VKKGCLIVAAAVAALFGTAGGIALYFWDQYHPVYHGKRLYAWADQAMSAPNPSTRKEAVAVLREALPNLRGEPRTQLLLYIAGPPAPLPPEMLPFLLDDLEVDEHPDSYISLALSRVRGTDAVRALTAVVQDSPNLRAREGAMRALGMMGAKAKEAVPALREAVLRNKGTELGRHAVEAWKQIDPESAANMGAPRN
jgi:hypothetical protein